MKAIDKIKQSYPEASDIKIAECFNPNEGWIKMFGINLIKVTLNRLIQLDRQEVTHINIRLIDQFGVERFPDYSIKELINS